MLLMKNKIHLVYNGISTFAMLTREDARTSLRKIIPSIPQDVLWIGTFSELVRNKGLSYVIDACALLKKSGYKFAFLILGNGELYDELTLNIQKQNLTDTVFLLGFVPDARSYLRAFDIFTLTSVKEGLPYVLLEAAQASAAIVASDIPGIRDIVENGESGILVSPKDSTTLADALDKLIKEPTLRERMGMNLERKVASDFSLASMLEQTIAVY
jgi:glycosyltransferase involved in cell wall biosynthesis